MDDTQTTQATEPATDPTHEWYAQATRLNAKLAIEPSAELIQHAQRLSQVMMEHVRSQVDDFDAFVERVRRSEELALTESAQVDKKEKPMKLLFLRAEGLMEAVQEAARFRR